MSAKERLGCNIVLDHQYASGTGQQDISVETTNSVNVDIIESKHASVLETKTCSFDELFKTKQLLKLHTQQHPNAEKPFQSKVCGQEFSVHAALENHLKRHSKTRNHHCDICGKSFVTKSDVAMHKRRHTVEKKFACDLCKKKFMYLSELNAHLKKHVGIKLPKNIECKTCGKTFMTKRDLGRHLTVHTGARPYECPLCGKCFSQEINMQVHIKIHTNVRAHKCSLCDKGFITKSKLVRHQLCHSGSRNTMTKPFKCVLCAKTFSSKTSLIQHLRRHQDCTQTLHSVTEILSQDKSTSNKKPGVLLASLIDRAISEAKLTDNGVRSDTSDLSQLIQQVICKSEPNCQGTQTPRDPHLKDSRLTTGLTVVEKETSSKLENSSNMITKPSAQTIVVHPKGKVINYGPTDHRKFYALTSQINPEKLNKSSIQLLPITIHQNGDQISFSHNKGPKVLILYPSSRPSGQPLVIVPNQQLAPHKPSISSTTANNRNKHISSTFSSPDPKPMTILPNEHVMTSLGDSSSDVSQHHVPVQMFQVKYEQDVSTPAHPSCPQQQVLLRTSPASPQQTPGQPLLLNRQDSTSTCIPFLQSSIGHDVTHNTLVPHRTLLSINDQVNEMPLAVTHQLRSSTMSPELLHSLSQEYVLMDSEGDIVHF